MSAFMPCNMKGYLWEMTPLLFVVLLASVSRTVLCQSEDYAEAVDEEPTDWESLTDGEPFFSARPTTSDATSTPYAFTTQDNTEDHGSAEETPLVVEGPDPTMTFPEDPDSTPEEESLNPIIVLVPVVLVVVIIAMVVGGIIISRRWNRKLSDADARQKDPYLDDGSTERVPMPMFEEDVPSVLELEMDELDQWMNRDGGISMDLKHT
ncbi:transmembrane protein 154 [Lampris incognitus]|uniref:transmembrane protein 154 n=1 Tax=Lampris incognitus TaxID=2546036 RepID=UPI0024B4E1C3|nr:transmembrane protein 154 [Lampris incognitus]